MGVRALLALAMRCKRAVSPLKLPQSLFQEAWKMIA
jgi:hypothetical protein